MKTCDGSDACDGWDICDTAFLLVEQSEDEICDSWDFCDLGLLRHCFLLVELSRKDGGRESRAGAKSSDKGCSL